MWMSHIILEWSQKVGLPPVECRKHYYIQLDFSAWCYGQRLGTNSSCRFFEFEASLGASVTDLVVGIWDTLHVVPRVSERVPTPVSKVPHPSVCIRKKYINPLSTHGATRGSINSRTCSCFLNDAAMRNHTANGNPLPKQNWHSCNDTTMIFRVPSLRQLSPLWGETHNWNYYDTLLQHTTAMQYGNPPLQQNWDLTPRWDTLGWVRSYKDE